jgi:hypothetical protein
VLSVFIFDFMLWNVSSFHVKTVISQLYIMSNGNYVSRRLAVEIEGQRTYKARTNDVNDLKRLGERN